MKSLHSAIRSFIKICNAITLVAVSLLFPFSIALAEAGTNNLHAFIAPDVAGPYNIGFLETTVPLYNGRLSQVRIWYPTLDQGASGSYVYYNPPGIPLTQSVNIQSKFGAIRNASVATGAFALIIENHPSNAANRSAALAQYPTNELLASHGFIVATYQRGDTPLCVGTVNDPRILIDSMLNLSAGIGSSTLNGVDFSNRIDPNKIGSSGISGGGIAVLSLASGISGNPSLNIPAIPADARVKALVMGEPSGNASTTCGLTAPQWAAITIPYLLVEGSPIIGLIEPPLFNGTTNALPRFDVHVPGLIHLGMGTGTCSMMDQERETSLSRQKISNPNMALQDPLLINVSSLLDGGVGADTFINWNLDAVLVRVGGARQFCNKVGVNSQFYSLNNGNGLTTIPPFGCSGPLSNVCSTFAQPANLTEEEINNIMYTYSVAFWEVYLNNDPRYKHFLTTDWASENLPNITITPIGVKGSNN